MNKEQGACYSTNIPKSRKIKYEILSARYMLKNGNLNLQN